MPGFMDESGQSGVCLVRVAMDACMHVLVNAGIVVTLRGPEIAVTLLWKCIPLLENVSGSSGRAVHLRQ